MTAQAAKAVAVRELQEQADDEERHLQAQVGLLIAARPCRPWPVRLNLQQDQQQFVMLQASGEDSIFADGSATASTSAAQVSECSHKHFNEHIDLSLRVCICLLSCLLTLSSAHLSSSCLSGQAGACMTALNGCTNVMQT